MSRLVVDLTEFREWSGHLTGVQRVVYNIAAQLQTLQEVKFVYFDPIHNQLIEDDLANYQQKVPASTSENPVEAPNSTAKKIAQTVYFKIPYSIRYRVTPQQKVQIKRLIRGSLHRARKLKTSVARKSAQQAVKIVPKDFFRLEANDTLLLAGRLWDHPDYIKFLQEQKKILNIKLAVIVYDLIPIYQQHTFGPGLTEPFARYVFHVLSMADIILPISKSSSNDLKNFAKESGFTQLPDIQVIRLGDTIETTGDLMRPPWVDNDAQPYILNVGTIEARKNHMVLYQVYKLAHEKGVKLPHIYIVGKPGWLTGDVLYFFNNDNDIKNSVTIKSNVTDEELNWLYANSLFTVYPSQYEGWGLPIAESLMHGVPCIASHASSMIEIAPSIAEYVSPFDTTELLDRMIYLSDEKNNTAARTKIAKQYKPTDWSDTAKQITKYLRSTER